jgi:glycosyltransferase involved in cell wall biosynthesis
MIYHSPTYSSILFPPKNLKVVLTIHDLMYRFVENYFNSINIINKILVYIFDVFVRINCFFATKIITISKTSHKDLSFLVKKEVNVVLHDCEYLSDGISDDKSPSSFLHPYLLYVGNLRKQKNIDLLVRAFKNSSKKNFQKLLIVSQESADFEDEDIIMLNGIDSEALVTLYRNAESSILPSHYEGFGLPVIESLSYQTNIICSNAGSLSEFSEKYVVFFESNSLKSLEKILDNWTEYKKNLDDVDTYLTLFSRNQFRLNMDQIISELG